MHVTGVWQWIALPPTLLQLSTICLGGVSILEHEAQVIIIAIVNVNVGEWILVGGLLRTDDVLNICLTISPVEFVGCARFFKFLDSVKISLKIWNWFLILYLCSEILNLSF